MSHVAEAVIDRGNRAAATSIDQKETTAATTDSIGDNIPEDTKGDGTDSDSSSTHMQDGVRHAEALTSVWDKNTMIGMFIL